LDRFIRLAVSPEPEQDRPTMHPQGSCRNKVSKGLNASYWPRGMSSTSPRDSYFWAIALSRRSSALTLFRDLRCPGDVGRPPISVPAALNPKDATSCLPAQSPRADHNRDRVPDLRPHIASDRSNSIDWKRVASRRHSTASIHLRILQPAASSTTRYGTG